VTSHADALAAQCRYLLTLADRMLVTLDDSHRALEPNPGTKTAGWLVGHLAVTGDFARRLCGRAPLCPPAWRPLFNPGSHPSHDASQYPAMSELCDALRAVYADLASAFGAATPEVLGAVNPYAPARDGFPTSGVFVQYMMTGHFGWHLGQLKAWTAAAGVGRVDQAGTVAA
jgi:hypothetical protein